MISYVTFGDYDWIVQAKIPTMGYKIPERYAWKMKSLLETYKGNET